VDQAPVRRADQVIPVLVDTLAEALAYEVELDGGFIDIGDGLASLARLVSPKGGNRKKGCLGEKSETRGNQRGAGLLLAGMAAVVGALALAAPAGAASGNWERAWGKNVNGGGVFGICTVAANCLAGTTGGLGGEMSSPLGVATDAAGNVYLADRLNHRIQKFDSAGTFERTWGKAVNMTTGGNLCTAASGHTCQAGTSGGLGGEMDSPGGVATDTAGNVYTTEESNHRIQKFDSAGTFERTWGKAVNMTTGGNLCTAVSGHTCQAGTAGGLGGEMDEPLGVATDAAGNVYLADENNHRIQRFDSSGTFERTWGKAVNMTTGGNLCTAVSGHTCQAGTAGGLGGEMSNPGDVATDAASNVYLAERSNNRIQRFDSAGTWERAWGKNVNGGGVFGVCIVAANCLAGTSGGLGGEMGSPRGVATDAAGNVYLADSSNHRIQKFADPVVTPPPPPGTGAGTLPTTTPSLTGRRAAALKKCKKKRGRARRNCKKRANKLPL
jgi:hypothetical protein